MAGDLPLSQYRDVFASFSDGFKAKIANWKTQANIADPNATSHKTFSKKDAPEFVDSGADGYVFKLHEANTEKTYAVKIFPKNDSYLDASMKAMHKVNESDIKNVSRLIAYDDQVQVQEFVEGKTLLEMNLKELSVITEEQLFDLFKTIDRLVSMKIDVDLADFDNLIYDPVRGFTIVDIKEMPDSVYASYYLGKQKEEIANDLTTEMDVVKSNSVVKDKKLKPLIRKFDNAKTRFLAL